MTGLFCVLRLAVLCACCLVLFACSSIFEMIPWSARVDDTVSGDPIAGAVIQRE
jgi:hypothetical protein